MRSIVKGGAHSIAAWWKPTVVGWPPARVKPSAGESCCE